MSAIFLKEINARLPGDGSLLDLFQHCREHVVAVAATPLMPAALAITTSNGFVQVVDTGSGGFRLFLPHLDRVPLDVELRCFALVPGLSWTSRWSTATSSVKTGGPFLIFSLAYSDELLLADTETGVTRPLARFAARPRAAFADGDFIACGDSAGTVAIWRATIATAMDARVSPESCSTRRPRPATDGMPQLLWRRAVGVDAVTHVRLDGDRLLCATADHRCCVLDVLTGSQLLRLAQPPEPLVAALTLGGHGARAFAAAVALVSTDRVSVYANPPALPPPLSPSPPSLPMPPLTISPQATAVVRTVTGPPLWDRACTVALGLSEVRCAAHLRDCLAIGTADGVVALYTSAPSTTTHTANHSNGNTGLPSSTSPSSSSGDVEEIVRFDVGHAVVSLQLYPAETLVVVTAAGDVWRWPLRDLVEGVDDASRSATASTATVAGTIDGVGAAVGAAAALSENEENTTRADVTTTGEGMTREDVLSDNSANSTAATAAEVVKVEEISEGNADAGEAMVMESDGVDSEAEEGRRHSGDDTGAEPWPSFHPPTPTARPPAVDATAIPDMPTATTTTTNSRDTSSVASTVNMDKHVTGSHGHHQGYQQRQQHLQRRAKASAAEPLCDPHASLPPLPSPEETGQSSQGCVVASGDTPVNAATAVDIGAGGCRRRNSIRSTTRSPTASTSRSAATMTSAPPSSVKRATHPTLELNVAQHMNRFRAAQTAAVRRVLRRVASPASVSATTSSTPQGAHDEGGDGGDPRFAYGGEGDGMHVGADARGLASHSRGSRRMSHGQAQQTPETHSGGPPVADDDGIPHHPQKPDSNGDMTAPPSLQLQSTLALLATREALSHTVFDAEAYARAHPLEVAALPYHHPIRPVRYGPQDRVFASVPRITGEGSDSNDRDQAPAVAAIADGGDGVASSREGRLCVASDGMTATDSRSKAPAHEGLAGRDDLVDATYGRVVRKPDPAWVRERQQVGPDMQSHPCEDLLYGPVDPSATVLFDEFQVRPTEPQPLMLPMPLPPTPSVF